VDGTLYSVRLEALDRHYANQRSAGYAVANSAKFGSDSVGGDLPAEPSGDEAPSESEDSEGSES
jgi:hypothetical protein